MDVLGAVQADALEQRRVVALHRQQLQERDAAGARRRGGDHVEAAPLALDRRAPDGLVAGEVGLADQALARPSAHLGDNQIGDRTLIEALGALFRDPVQRGGELRLAEDAVRGHAAEVAVEVGLGEGRAAFLALLDLAGRDREALPRQADGRRQVARPGKLAEPPMRLGHAAHGARHARRQRAHQAGFDDRLALGVQVHAGAGLGRGGLTIVEEVGLAVDIEGQEPATTQISGLRIGHRQDEGRGFTAASTAVAAGLQHLLRGQAVSGRARPPHFRREAPAARLAAAGWAAEPLPRAAGRR